MRIFLRIVFVLVVVAVLVGVGMAIYNMGVMQGVATSGQLSSSDGAPAYPYYAPFYGPWGWGVPGFGCLAFLGLLLIFPLIFGLMRFIFGPRHGWFGGPWGMGGPRGFDRDHIPPRIEELHRRMHEKMNEPPTPQA
jgi:hypothetical protein